MGTSESTVSVSQPQKSLASFAKLGFVICAVVGTLVLMAAQARNGSSPTAPRNNGEERPILSVAFRDQLTPQEVPGAELDVAAQAEGDGDYQRALSAFEQARWDAKLAHSMPVLATVLREEAYFLTRRWLEDRCSTLQPLEARSGAGNDAWCQEVAEETANRALRLDEEYDLTEGIVRDHLAFGWIYLKFKKPSKALQHYQDARQLAEAHVEGEEQFAPLLAAALHGAAYLVRNDNWDPAEALKFLQQAMTLEGRIATDRLEVIRQEEGTYYLDLEMWDQAKEAFSRSQSYWQALPSDYVYRGKSARDRADKAALLYNLTLVLQWTSGSSWQMSVYSNPEAGETPLDIDATLAKMEDEPIFAPDGSERALYLLTRGEALRLAGRCSSATKLIKSIETNDDEILALAHEGRARCCLLAQDNTCLSDAARHEYRVFSNHKKLCELPYMRSRYEVMLRELEQFGDPQPDICPAN